jgi:L-ascorbate metabolism protein UlaG (beta-lactamase superfamily)
MNRRGFFKYFGLSSLALVGIGGAWSMLRTPKNPYYSGPKSDHFNGLTFFSPGRERLQPKSRIDLLKWQFGGGKEAWPSAFPSPFQDRPPQSVTSGIRVTLIGHASYLIQTEGLNILIDPVWTERASPVSFAGPRRVNAPGIRMEDVPRIDAILVTHNHYDHMDIETLGTLVSRGEPRLIVPLGNDVMLRNADPRLSVARAHDWGDSIELSDRLKITLEPTLHWSARSLGDRSMALWCNFVIEATAGRIYACGDTGYDANSIFPIMKAKYGGFKLALLPIGAYEPRWFMRQEHMNPEEAVTVMQELGAEKAIGHHWGTFPLTNEGIEKPRLDLARALQEKNISQERFLAFQPGQVWEG